MNKDFTQLKEKLLHNHPLAPYTAWKIGGPAQYFYPPANLSDFSTILKLWQEEPITILGAASNVLIRDGGVKGLVIYLRDNLKQLTVIDDNNLYVEAGVPLVHLLNTCAGLGMLDAAFLAGIPGTLGGALKMNAGAYEQHIWNYVTAVKTINRQGIIQQKAADEFTISYRQINGLAPNEWFVAAKLYFPRNNVARTKAQIASYLQKRATNQPLHLPSCGSVFRNPKGDYAARLIAACDFKNKKCGDAQVSNKHANFILNCGNATAADVETLMQNIITTVEKKHGIILIPEVHILGEKIIINMQNENRW